MQLPWNKKSERKMIKEEMWELVDIMRNSKPEDPTYQTAFNMYKELRAQELELNKLRTYKIGRVIDVVGTFGLAGIVLTHEYWTPTTSSWARNLSRPFSHNDNGLLN